MANKIDKIFTYVGLILIVIFAILTLCGCVNGKAGINDNPVIVKPEIQSPEQTSDQEVNAGGNVNQLNLSLAGGGAVASIMMIVIGVLGMKYLNALKAFKTCADVIEQKGHPFKRAVEFHAGETGIEKYIHKKVKKWYR